MENDNEIKTISDALVTIGGEESIVYSLVPNSNRTVQPIALMRLGVFVPSAKSKPVRGSNVIDVSEDFRELEIAKAEGYTDITLRGSRLDMSTDFKTWIGSVRAFSKYGQDKNSIQIPFTEFAKLCGIAVDDINKRARDRLFHSLSRLSSITISFKNKDASRATITHLLQSATFDIEKDIVHLEGDSRLWELYAFDHKVLLQLKAIKALPRKESAQALYVYIESMPRGFIQISMARLKDRLSLTSSNSAQNLAVRNAMKELEKIGYLTYTETKKDGVVYFLIHSRRPELIPEP